MDMRVGVDRARRGRRAVLHAVPVGDRTRSAVCGSSIRRTEEAWSGRVTGACPDCLAVLQLGRTA